MTILRIKQNEYHAEQSYNKKILEGQGSTAHAALLNCLVKFINHQIADHEHIVIEEFAS